MTNPGEESVEKAIRNARASMELSGFKITEKQENLIRSKLNGEISEEEFLRIALEMAKE